MKKHIALLAFFILFFTSCGGGGGSASSSTNYKIAYLYDTAVNGVEYTCGNISGITGDAGTDGSFRYQESCDVEFRLGKIYLGKIQGGLLSDGRVIYPTTLLGLSDTNIDERVVNILVLLQTLDSDSNLSNGIVVSKEDRVTLASETINSLDLTSISPLLPLESIHSILGVVAPTKIPVSRDEALLHFQNTLNNEGYTNINLANPTPYLVDINGNKTTLTQIFTRHTTQKDIILKGKAGTKIFLGFSATETNSSNISFFDTTKTLNSSGLGYLTLDFDNDSIADFNYFIKLLDDKNESSSPLLLNVQRDFTPPHLANTLMTEYVLEQDLFFKNIQSSDGARAVQHEIVSVDEDNRSTNWEDFNISADGIIQFVEEPDFDGGTKNYSVVARAIDAFGNMTDVFFEVFLTNILDNRPILATDSASVSIDENDTNGTFIYDASDFLETDLTLAPDNNRTGFPMVFRLIDDINGSFAIDPETGIITIYNKNGNSALFDYEQSPNTIDLNISIDNNNTKYKDANGTTLDCNTSCPATVFTSYATVRVAIENVIDTPPSLQNPPSVSIPEHGYTGVVATIEKNISASDFDPTMTFSIEPEDPNFIIDPTTGKVTLRPINTLDFETSTLHTLTIQATNSWWNDTNHSTQVTLDINITNEIDTAPVITLLSSAITSLEENASAGTIIATVAPNGTTIDTNTTDSYEIVEVLRNNALYKTHPFKINNSGVITTNDTFLAHYIEDLNSSSITTFKVQVKGRNNWWNGNDTNNSSNLISIILDVTNVIDNPPILLTPDRKFFEENSSTPLGTLLTTLIATGTSSDNRSIEEFEIVSGNSEGKIYDINSSGEIRLKELFDWEKTIIYNFEIRAKNRAWDGTTQSSNSVFFTIDINNTIESPPSIWAPSTLVIHENVDIGTLLEIIEINSTEEDKKTIDTLTITNGNSEAKFKLSELKKFDTTGLSYKELLLDGELDFETTPNYLLTITATNEGGNTTKDINITIKDDLEPNLPLLVLRVAYADINLTTPPSDIFNQIFSTNDHEIAPPIFGSLNDYFYRVSNRKFLFKKASETDGTADGIVTITLGTNHPKTDINQLEADVRSALTTANSSVDFTLFDTDGDGSIASDELQILILIAGGEITYGDTNTSIKGTKGALGSSLPLDGKCVASTACGGNYVVIGERNGENPASIGLMAHHLGNSALEFPYLGDQTGASFGIGFFGLMGYGYRGFDYDAINTKDTQIGSYPVNPSAYNLISQGWLYPRTIKKTTEIDFVASNKGSDGFNIVKIETVDPKIYYLLENRILTNSTGYDIGFYGMEGVPFVGGLALWKINENKTNNNDVNNKLVDFVEYDKDSGLDSSRIHYGKASSLYHAGMPNYPDISEFTIGGSSMDDTNTNTINATITIP